MFPRRLRATYREMNMPQEEPSSSTRSSLGNSSAHNEEASQTVDQDSAMDDFMGD